MNIMQTPVTGVSFSGEVKGKKGFTCKTSQFADQYAYGQICYTIRNNAQTDSLTLQEKDGTTTLKGEMKPGAINLLAATWSKMSNFFDKDESTKGRNFEAKVTPEAIKFQYEYADGEKFEWSRTKAEHKGVTGWNSIAENMKDLFKDIASND